MTVSVSELDIENGTARVDIGAQREITNELDEVLKTQENYSITWQLQENGVWLADGFSGNY